MGRTSRQSEAVLPRKEFLNEIGLIFGAKHESAAVVPDGTTEPVRRLHHRRRDSRYAGGQAIVHLNALLQATPRRGAGPLDPSP